jgi:CubicO group peptidase (beta-lactamase class C family)
VVMSATKAWTALVIHKLIEQGAFTLETPVCALWPEFAAFGKADVAIGHVLDHTAGLPALPAGARGLDFDQDKWERALAAAPLLHPPGERRIYHAVTQGFLLNALIRRAAREDVRTLFAAHFAGPLGLEAAIGLQQSASFPLAEILTAKPIGPPPAQHALEPILQLMDPPDFNAPAFLRAVVPAANGLATARAMAGLYAGLIAPTRQIISGETLTRARALRWDGPEEMSGARWRMAAGLMLSTDYAYFGPNLLTFGHPGRGGATGFADPDLGLAVGYVLNAPDPRPGSGARLPRLIKALLAAL